jgi:polysaccharide export outer membrane protein
MKKKIIYLFLLSILMGGCGSSKKIIYLQDVKTESKKIDNSYELKIQEDDLLSITVNSKNPELSLPFNLPLVAYQTGRPSDQTMIGGTLQLQGHLVDSKGDIYFPILGKIHAAGRSRLELANLIKDSLIKNDYIKDPIVNVRLLNYKISVMGEVTRPGTFPITSDRLTLLDALSMAGDLTIYGKRNRVYVIREDMGQRTINIVDLRSSDIFSSPYYYLHQNDIVYVEPNRSRIGQSVYDSNLPLVISAVSILTTIFLFFLK